LGDGPLRPLLGPVNACLVYLRILFPVAMLGQDDSLIVQMGAETAPEVVYVIQFLCSA
jgi:hypothetical protein